jgi:hypothetical protein
MLVAYLNVLFQHPPEGAEKLCPFSQFGSTMELEIKTFRTLYTAPRVAVYLIKT